MEKEFWRRITRDEIITDYNTKAVNVDAYQRRDNNSDTAGKVKNETRQQRRHHIRACLHGSGVPKVGEVTRLGGVKK